MHFILLGVGVLIGLYGLYRFFLNASLKQISALIMVSGFIVICIALFYLAVTGRLPAALGLLAAIWPLALSYVLNKQKARKNPDNKAKNTHNKSMTRAEALEILGLGQEATAAEIKNAHKKLMKKAHPDQEGSEWMAKKLNEARDVLLDDV